MLKQQNFCSIKDKSPKKACESLKKPEFKE